MTRAEVAFDVSGTREPWVVLGPSHSEALRAQFEALEAKGGRLHHFQASDLLDTQGIFRAFAEELAFPGYFGWNWDAMVDCLDDLCEAVTGGVGMVGVIHGADRLIETESLRLFVSVLCQGAARANSAVDLDGDLLDRPAVVQHFVLLLDELDASDFTAVIDDPDLVVRYDAGFTTVTLDPEVWYS